MSNKRAIIYAQNIFYSFNHDEWDSFRAEGRIPINIGFGLSLLNYDVNIICSTWKMGRDNPKKTWNSILLSNFPIHDYYDLAISFGHFHSRTKFGKGVSIIYEDSHIKQANSISDNIIKSGGTEKLLIAYPLNWKHIMDNIEEKYKKKIYYFPPLYPIPSINIGFLPCTYDPKLPILKIFLHGTSWPQNTTISGNRFIHKQQMVIDFLKSKGYKIKLSVLVENRSIRHDIVNDDITYFYSNECNYRDLIDILRSVDICITYGAPVFGGSSLNDMVSLGKPIIYIADGRLEVEWKNVYTNLVYKYPGDLIYIQEPYIESIEKLEKFIKSPIDICKKRSEMYKDCNFNIWKNIIEKVLE